MQEYEIMNMGNLSSVNEWEELIKEVKDVHTYATRLLSYYEWFNERNNKNLDTILNTSAKECILGGLNSTGFSEYSYHNFCRDVLGINIQEDEFRQMIVKYPFEDVARSIKIIVRENILIEKIKELREVVSYFYPTSYLPYQQVPTANGIKDAFEGLINSLISLSPHYNEYISFLLRTSCIAKKYLDQLCPPDEYKELFDYLGLNRILEVTDYLSKKGYDIYGYEYSSKGERLLQIFDKVMEIIYLLSSRSGKLVYPKYILNDKEWRKYVNYEISGRDVRNSTKYIQIEDEWHKYVKNVLPFIKFTNHNLVKEVYRIATSKDKEERRWDGIIQLSHKWALLHFKDLSIYHYQYNPYRPTYLCTFDEFIDCFTPWLSTGLMKLKFDKYPSSNIIDIRLLYWYLLEASVL